MDVPTNLLRTVIPIMKSSPVEISESPPPSELPRTPSPTSPPTIYSTQRSPLMLEQTNDINNAYSGGNCITTNHNNPYGDTNLKIPLKYQRQSKVTSQKHFKKKFRERTWGYDEYDKDDGLNGDEYTGNGSNTQYQASKFRPKGKDWDWRDHRKEENDPAHA